MIPRFIRFLIADEEVTPLRELTAAGIICQQIAPVLLVTSKNVSIVGPSDMPLGQFALAVAHYDFLVESFVMRIIKEVLTKVAQKVTQRLQWASRLSLWGWH